MTPDAAFAAMVMDELETLRAENTQMRILEYYENLKAMTKTAFGKRRLDHSNPLLGIMEKIKCP
jgi:hypothetical protein